MIQINNLHYNYPNGVKALDGVNIVIKEKKVAIIGPNGAGKTTLLLHLNGLLIPKKGEIFVNNLKVEKKNFRKIRQILGIVFQNPEEQLFFPTVYDDVAFGPRNLGFSETEVKLLVRDALAKVGMLGFENRNPYHLSLGEKKKIAIATILSMKPKIIIFDEPTELLDPKAKKQILRVIDSFDGMKIIATHDLDIANNCDIVHILYKGKIVYSGNNLTRSLLERYELL